MGVTWLARWRRLLCDRSPAERPAGRALVRVLLSYAFLVRGLVALFGVVATRFGLGTHYDVSPVTSVAVALTGDSFSFVPGAASRSSGSPSSAAPGVARLHRGHGMLGAALARLLARPERTRRTLRSGYLRGARTEAQRRLPNPQRVEFDGLESRVLP